MDLVTVVTGLATVGLVVLMSVNFFSRRPFILTHEDKKVPDWERYAVGHRFGPSTAKVTIVEWGDYECPPCKGFHAAFETVSSKYPEEVALVFRHWPLATHGLAYSAAKAAECAAEQGAFEGFHRLLMETPGWMESAFPRYAEASGVADLKAFEECVSDPSPVPAIERDKAMAEELGGRGTPTLIVNGTHLGATPEAAELEKIIQNALG